MSERRRSERFTGGREIYARFKSSIPVKIIDVSHHGMKVESNSALPPTGPCDLWIPGEQGDVKLKVRVQRCRARFEQEGDERGLVYQAGIEFLQLDVRARDALFSILQQFGATLEEARSVTDAVRASLGEDEADDDTGFEISTAV